MGPRLYDGLWSPRVREMGVETSIVVFCAESFPMWSKKFRHLGVPKSWPEDWDFFAAISACANDLSYHSLWLHAESAIAVHGLHEGDGVEKPWSPELAKAHERIQREAVRAALRIAALVSDSASVYYTHSTCKRAFFTSPLIILPTCFSILTTGRSSH